MLVRAGALYVSISLFFLDDSTFVFVKDTINLGTWSGTHALITALGAYPNCFLNAKEKCERSSKPTLYVRAKIWDWSLLMITRKTFARIQKLTCVPRWQWEIARYNDAQEWSTQTYLPFNERYGSSAHPGYCLTVFSMGNDSIRLHSCNDPSYNFILYPKRRPAI